LKPPESDSFSFLSAVQKAAQDAVQKASLSSNSVKNAMTGTCTSCKQGLVALKDKTASYKPAASASCEQGLVALKDKTSSYKPAVGECWQGLVAIKNKAPKSKPEPEPELPVVDETAMGA